MKASLPIFAGLFMAAGVAALAGLPIDRHEQPQAPSDERDAIVDGPAEANPDEERSDESDANRAEILVRSALAGIEQRDSISARLRVQIDSFNQQIEGSGDYRQGPWSESKLRLSLEFSLPATTAKLVQICDGHQLWIARTMPHEDVLERADILPILSALDRGAVPKPTADAVRTLGLGGLPRLLRGLDDSFEFSQARPRMLGDMPIWTIEGTWRMERLCDLLPDQRQALEAGRTPDLTKLPPQAPDRVRLILGRDDLFPYRIEWLRTGASIERKWQQFGRDQSRTLLKLDLLDVQLDGPINDDDFYFDPGEQNVKDVTADYLKSMAP